MKKTLLLSILLLIVTLVFSQPKITFNDSIHDYGTIKKDSNGNCSFVFKNTGTEPVMITKVTSMQGCVYPYYFPKYPIAPGESDTIKVKYLTTKVGAMNYMYNKAGDSGCPVKVETNVRTVTLFLKGTVVE